MADEKDKQIIIPFSEYQEMQAKVLDVERQINDAVSKAKEECRQEKDKEFRKFIYDVIGNSKDEILDFRRSSPFRFEPLLSIIYQQKKRIDELFMQTVRLDNKISEYKEVEKKAENLKYAEYRLTEEKKILEKENAQLKQKLNKRKWWQKWK